jgi:serine/threonine-protein kinase
MATVYLGRMRGAGGFERRVALKRCHPHLRRQEDFDALFLDEARLAARIHHPNVVATLDVVDGPSLFIVLEYVEGGSLADLLKAAVARQERLPPPVVLRIVLDTLAGLHAAHELRDDAGVSLGLIHRDVSPQNVLVGVDGVARLADFGIVKAERRSGVTREGRIKGKLPYMAPEQFGRAPVHRQVDVYAAGVVLWEALAGRRLFRGQDDAEVLERVLRGEVPPLSRFIPVPAALDAVLARALSKAPAQRFATAAALADALEGLGLPVASPRTVGACVEELLAPALALRRAHLRAEPVLPLERALAEEPPPELPQLAGETGPDAMTTRALRPPPRPALKARPPPRPALKARPPPGARRWAWRALGAAVAAVALGVFASAGGAAPEAPGTPATAAAPVPGAAPPPREVEAPAVAASDAARLHASGTPGAGQAVSAVEAPSPRAEPPSATRKRQGGKERPRAPGRRPVPAPVDDFHPDQI